MIRDAQFYRDRLAELEAETQQGGRNVEQLIEDRRFCRQRIIECEYQEAVAVILDRN